MYPHQHDEELFPEDHAEAVRHLHEMHGETYRTEHSDVSWQTLADEHATFHSIQDPRRGMSD